MKRRTGDAAKVRRPLKRTPRIADSIYSSTLLYLKFLLIWAIVILSDFILEFRFEFLWPLWMLFRSVYDSFKYQGLAFSMFFVCIALTSDIICFFFIPVQWVFFAASTYVWVQYIWYTDKGICLPTMLLCSLFVYMEAGIRLRDLRHMPAHLDLCRPFAAHCIGYPVVTLGFGFKSYVGYRMRKRRQQEVARENSFYMQLLQQALPPHEETLETSIKEMDKTAVSLDRTSELLLPDKQMNGSAIHLPSVLMAKSNSHKKSEVKINPSEKVLSSPQTSVLPNHTSVNTPPVVPAAQSSNVKEISPESSGVDSGISSHSKNQTSQNLNNVAVSSATSTTTKEKDTKIYTQIKHSQTNGHVCTEKSAASTPQINSLPEKPPEPEKSPAPVVHSIKEEQKPNHVPIVENNISESEIICDKNVKATSKYQKLEKKDSNTSNQREERRKHKNRDYKDKDHGDSGQKHDKHSDSKDKDSEPKSTHASERVVRSAMAAERQARADSNLLRQQVEQLSSKLSAVNASRQADRAALAAAERQLNEEKRARQAASARLRGLHKSGDCGWDWCRQRRTALEQDVTNMREELKQLQDQNTSLTQSLETAEEQVTTLEARSRDNGAEAWVATVKTLHERCVHLERSLSAETRVKLDLFSAVGEAKRQLDLREDIIRQQEKENEELKSKIAQMLAVMPTDSFSAGPIAGISKLRLTENSCYPSQLVAHQNNSLPNNNLVNNSNNNMSNLDPNATVYTPKGSMVQCGSGAEA